jgi:hypothetical protein
MVEVIETEKDKFPVLGGDRVSLQGDTVIEERFHWLRECRHSGGREFLL